MHTGGQTPGERPLPEWSGKMDKRLERSLKEMTGTHPAGEEGKRTFQKKEMVSLRERSESRAGYSGVRRGHPDTAP